MINGLPFSKLERIFVNQHIVAKSPFRFNLVAVLLAGLAVQIFGCGGYKKLVRHYASEDISCPQEGIIIKQKSKHGYPIRFEASGCGHVAAYDCWDDAPPAATTEEAWETDKLCAILMIDGQAPQHKPMSEEEAVCHVECRKAAAACISGCGDYSECLGTCDALEQGCIDGGLQTAYP